jgi:hypothetical protein
MHEVLYGMALEALLCTLRTFNFTTHFCIAISDTHGVCGVMEQKSGLGETVKDREEVYF